MSRKLISLGLAFSMLGGLALAQGTSTGTPNGSQGTNTSPATEGTLNGNHGSSTTSSPNGNTSPSANGSTEKPRNPMGSGNAMGSGPGHSERMQNNGSSTGTISGGGNTGNSGSSK
jgi:hypothetical protein